MSLLNFTFKKCRFLNESVSQSVSQSKILFLKLSLKNMFQQEAKLLLLLKRQKKKNFFINNKNIRLFNQILLISLYVIIKSG